MLNKQKFIFSFRSKFLSSRQCDDKLRDPCPLRRRQDHPRQGGQHRHLHRPNKVNIHFSHQTGQTRIFESSNKKDFYTLSHTTMLVKCKNN
jgi:hypothetical protein